MAIFTIRHTTTYTYARAASYSANQIILYPIKDEWQHPINHVIDITENPIVAIHTDYFGNNIGTFTLIEPHTQLIIDSKLTIQTTARTKPNITQSTAEQWKELYNKAAHLPYADFLKIDAFKSRNELQQMIDARNHTQYNPYQIATYFCQQVFEQCTYIKGVTTVETTLDEIWQSKQGVCQDFAHLMLALLRLVNIPARYVSGYICPNNNGMRGDGATHAWVEAYLPFYGWLGFDPTNNCIANDKHVRLAVGRNFSDCSPVKGTYRGDAHHQLEVFVSVQYDTKTANKILQQPTTTSNPMVTQNQNGEEQQQQ